MKKPKDHEKPIYNQQTRRPQSPQLTYHMSWNKAIVEENEEHGLQSCRICRHDNYYSLLGNSPPGSPFFPNPSGSKVPRSSVPYMCFPRMSLTVYCLQDAPAVPASVTVLLVWVQDLTSGINRLLRRSFRCLYNRPLHLLSWHGFVHLRHEISQEEHQYSRQDWVGERVYWQDLVGWKAVKPLCTHNKLRT